MWGGSVCRVEISHLLEVIVQNSFPDHLPLLAGYVSVSNVTALSSHPVLPPPPPPRLFETLQSLFWSIFGLLNLYVTNVKARHEFTEFIGATMFGTYNVISLVVLLNMLIAMMNNSYQLIAVGRRSNQPFPIPGETSTFPSLSRTTPTSSGSSLAPSCG